MWCCCITLTQRIYAYTVQTFSINSSSFIIYIYIFRQQTPDLSTSSPHNILNPNALLFSFFSSHHSISFHSKFSNIRVYIYVDKLECIIFCQSFHFHSTISSYFYSYPSPYQTPCSCYCNSQ